MKTITCILLVLGLLCDNVTAIHSISSLRAAAVALQGELPCIKWDCECAFKHQRDCCCATSELQEVEAQIFVRMMDLWSSISQLGNSILKVIDSGGTKVAFTASMSQRTNCIGPFTSNIPLAYNVITLNQGSGYNPSLGLFTAPCAGLHSFSFSVYSKLDEPGDRMYCKVQLMKNGEVMASTWENNREDSEDSGSQTILVSVEQGGQVYLQLLSGLQLCGNANGLNTFSGFLIYPTLA